MAFCPHCGKSVTDQASKCLACGEEFEPRAKAARFKGTMMMSPGAAGALPLKPAAPAPSTEPAATPPAAAAAPEPAAQPAPRAPTPAPSKVGKHTMLGTGGAGLAPPIGRPSAQQAAMPKAPPPAAAPAAKPAPAPPPAAAAGGTAPALRGGATDGTAPALRGGASTAEDDMALAATTRQRTEASGDAATDATGGAEDSQRFLVGDPMAPSPQAAGRSGRRSAEDPTIPGLNAPSAAKLLTIAIGGMLVIAIVGYATARYMGLLN